MALGRKASVAVGIAGGLAIVAVALMVGEGFFVVRRSPCVGMLRQIGQAQRVLYADHNRYTDNFAELEGIVPKGPHTYALSTGHPSGLKNNSCPDCQFVATCSINVPSRQVWSIASVERSVLGQTVAAFEPFNDISGD